MFDTSRLDIAEGFEVTDEGLTKFTAVRDRERGDGGILKRRREHDYLDSGRLG
jgi:hypothetical protein